MSSMEVLGKAEALLQEGRHRHHFANSSAINDGAAALVIMSERG